MPKVVVFNEKNNPGADVIAILAATSETVSVSLSGNTPPAPSANPAALAWLSAREDANSLEGAKEKPWHLVIAFEQFDDDGDKVNQGTLEEIWASPVKYKRSYKSDKLNQTDYATDGGLYRVGDQRWPNRAEVQLRSEVVTPFSGIDPPSGLVITHVQETFGKFQLDCGRIELPFGHFDAPREFCFDPGTAILRYKRGAGWYQTAYNSNIQFEGHPVADEVTVTDGGKPYLKLHITNLEEAAAWDEETMTPPTGATKIGDEISGVQIRPLHTEPPEWPDSARQKHFTVAVELLVGKDGKVETAKAVSGPIEFYKYAEKSAKKWTFQPFLVLGQPVKVHTRINLSMN